MMGTVIGKELGIGVRTPEGAWDWIGRKRSELGNLGRVLTNREMFGYFRGANVVKTHKLNPIIANRCLDIDFIAKLEASDAEEFHDMIGKELERMNEFLNTEALGKQFV